MKIIAFEAENFKRISTVAIKPDGSLVQITGRNGAGKTSVLDAIWVALDGATNIQSVPIRRGADKARIRLDLGEMVVTRTFNKREEGYTTAIKVETVDGFRAQSPQKMLDSFLGTLTFDPLAFTRMEPRKQFDELRRFVPDVDFDDIDAKNKADFAARTVVNRDAKAAYAAAAQIVVPDALPAEPIDEAALTARLAAAGNHNASIEARGAARRTAEETIQRLEAEREGLSERRQSGREGIERRRTAAIQDIERQIEALRARTVAIDDAANSEITDLTDEIQGRNDDLTEQAADLRRRLEDAPPLPDPVDTGALTLEIAAARSVNEGIRARTLRADHIGNATALGGRSDALTKAMDDRTKTKTDAIAAAALPVPGLGFGDGAVTLNGLPFDQASDAEQLRASIAIAMAANPKLRVIRVRDGSLLDDEGLKLLAEMADEKDYQVWIERVSSDGRAGFMLEDGQIKDEAKREPVPAAEVREGVLL